MKNALIIHFDEHHISDYLAFYYSIIHGKNYQKVFLLTYCENIPFIFDIIPEDCIIAISKETLSVAHQQNLIPPHFLYNYVSQKIDILDQWNWDMVVNFDDHTASKILAGFINPHKIIGHYLERDQKVNYQSFKDYYHHHLRSCPMAPYNTIELHRIHDIPFVDKEIKIPLHEKELKKTHLEVRKIHEKLKSIKKNESIKLIGLSILDEYHKLTFSTESIATFIKLLRDHPSLYPVVLTNDQSRDSSTFQEIFKILGQKIVVVESDYIGLSSVMIYFDLIVGYHHHHCLLADFTSTPLIEIHNSKKPLFFNNTIRPGNQLIFLDHTNDLSEEKRNFPIHKVLLGISTLQPDVVFEHLNFHEENGLEKKHHEIVFEVVDDEGMTWYVPCSLEKESLASFHKETIYHLFSLTIERIQIQNSFLKKEIQSSSLEIFLKFKNSKNENFILEWISDKKNIIKQMAGTILEFMKMAYQKDVLHEEMISYVRQIEKKFSHDLIFRYPLLKINYQLDQKLFHTKMILEFKDDLHVINNILNYIESFFKASSTTKSSFHRTSNMPS
jgi:hypothetical protein